MSAVLLREKNLDDAGALDLMFQGLILDFADQVCEVKLSGMPPPLCIVKNQAQGAQYSLDLDCDECKEIEE